MRTPTVRLLSYRVQQLHTAYERLAPLPFCESCARELNHIEFLTVSGLLCMQLCMQLAGHSAGSLTFQH